MSVRLLFFHGWGFDSAIWDKVVAMVESFEIGFADRGYFGGFREDPSDGTVLAVAHSFGAMRVLANLPTHCAGMVAVNGFDYFAAHDGYPGVPRRVLDRMIGRFGVDPEATLSDFRMRCGASRSLPTICGDALGADLIVLRDGDCRDEAATFGAPILSLQGGADPIMPLAMRDAVFAHGQQVSRIVARDGGHLLPLTHPELCAKAILQLAERVA
ncbi:alpha/beta hydrolase [Croceicoccus ponticola]|uniref:Alpha/beta hydrolase n=1 Tax=Croceicoccus ponticola TaxID=2217664 RepID=A0A437GVU9_9SPHN|nr:alpha/beta hydrolase [Croceicoccus ponticola]RVQ66027.1 alpha/beta hydrolase [Croceicoccus ponticola]